MVYFRNMAVALILGTAATAPAASAPAKDRAKQGIAISSHRVAAVQECYRKSVGFLEFVWGHQQSDKYRACMAEHREKE